MNHEPTTIALEKENRVRKHLRELGRVAIAFSGGVDSSYLVKLAHEELGQNVLALTARSPSLASRERERVDRFVKRWNLPHRWVDTNELTHPEYVANPPQRCYHCKKTILQTLEKVAKEQGFTHLLDGENAEDAGDFRPGNLAAKEMGVVRPLEIAGMTKTEIREQSRALNLEDTKRPATPCLASRIAYGTPVTIQRLRLVETVENRLLAAGFSPCRARIDGDGLRIEVAKDTIAALASSSERTWIVQTALSMGMKTVSLDLEGFVSGKLNRMVDTNE